MASENQPIQAQVSEMTVLKRRLTAPEPQSRIQWRERMKRDWAGHFTRNVAVATLALLAFVAARDAAEPEVQSVFQSAGQVIRMDLDETLGKLTFVTRLFPEDVLVFAQSQPVASLNVPVGDAVVHAWRASEPYIEYASGSSAQVVCAADGEVMAVAHGEDEELILRVRHENGLETLYGNLDTSLKQLGDTVQAGEALGTLRKGRGLAFEVKRDGRLVDPTPYFLAP